jgi:hydroxyacylglutathione hydrolase
MKIQTIINPHRLSNTYVLELENDFIVLIDVGNFNKSEFKDWVVKNNKKIAYVLLTHEHADHCCGVDELYGFQQFELICSSECAENIKNSKQNFSYYLEDIEEFKITTDKIKLVKDLEVLTLHGYDFTFIKTPGHSPGGVCILVENCFFSGDTILNGIKTPLSFPHSSRKDYKISLEKIKTFLEPKMIIYPGHDSSFEFNNQLIFD